MPRQREENEVKHHVIYVLVSAISNEFYVGKTTAATPKTAYKFHAGGKHTHTKSLFAQSRAAKKFPQMYLLEEVDATPKEAFGNVVAWTKYFMEQGFKPIAYRAVLRFTNDLYEENEAIYSRIKELKIDAVLLPENLLVSDYKPQEKQETTPEEDATRDRVITLHLTPDNYELISSKAKEAKKSLSKYCQAMALDGFIATITVWDFTDEIRKYKGVLREIFTAIQQHGKYYPADLANIIKLTESVNQTQKKVAQSLEEQTEKLVGYKKLQLVNHQLKKRIEALEEQLKNQ